MRRRITPVGLAGVARLTLFLMVPGILGRSLLEYVAVVDAALLGATAAAVLEVTAANELRPRCTASPN